MPIIFGAPGAIKKNLEEKVEEIKIKGRIGAVHTTALLRRVLESYEEFLSLRLQWKPSCHWGKALVNTNFINRKKKVNYLMYSDDINLFAKNEKELETLLQAVRIYSDGIGMEFGIEKYAILIIKRGKTTNDGRNRTTKSRKNQNAWRKGNLQIRGNIGSGRHQTCGDERKIKIDYLRRTRKLRETKLHRRDKYVGCPPHKIFGTNLKVGERKTLTDSGLCLYHLLICSCTIPSGSPSLLCRI